MTTKSRQSIYGASVRAAAERAKEAHKEANRLACDAWTKRMLGFKGPAQPSPTLGDALNAGYLYLEVRKRSHLVALRHRKIQLVTHIKRTEAIDPERTCLVSIWLTNCATQA
jgi:hypothetical protein